MNTAVQLQLKTGEFLKPEEIFFTSKMHADLLLASRKYPANMYQKSKLKCIQCVGWISKI